MDKFNASRIRIASVVGCIVAALVAPASPSFAAGQVDEVGTGEAVLEALQSVTGASGDDAPTGVLKDVAVLPESEADGVALEGAVNGVRITVPSDPSAPIELAATTLSVSVGLPFGAQAQTADELTDGVLAYDNDNGSTTVPVVKDDGSLQIATIIANADAPMQYAYRLDLSAGYRLVPKDDGAVVILDGDGDYRGAFAPPWARDAKGSSVPTRYVVQGRTLTQVVDHRVPGTSYPVTADPYLGVSLISSGRWVTRSSQGRTLEITPTPWGRANGSNPSAFLPLQSEYCSRFGSGCTTQMWYQLQCHAQFATFKATWNLDSWRWRASYADSVAHGCN